jgi:LacI family transcriptional regulator
MDKIKKITIQDIAKYANVSVGTVDRVIHKRGKVSDEKKERIEDAIKKLNFNPNLLARTLALGKRFRVCTLFPNSPYPGHYWSLPKIGIERAGAMYKDFGIVVESYSYNLFDEVSFIRSANLILESNPSGVILAPRFLNESLNFVKRLNEKEIPYVFIDTDIPAQKNLTYIGPDVEQSAYIAARLLNSVIKVNGDILILNMFKGIENAAALKRMELGFKKYFKEKGFNEKRIQVLTINSTNKDVVFRDLTKFYIRNNNVNGVFVTNSKAFLVSEFHLAHDLDIRVIGYDLVAENISQLKFGGIDFIISQSPIQQGVKSLQTLFELFIYNTKTSKTQHVPLDIIIKENVEFYTKFYSAYF